MICDTAQYFCEPSLWFDAVEFGSFDQGNGHGFASTLRTGKHPILPAYGHWLDCAFAGVVVEFQKAVVEIGFTLLALLERSGSTLADIVPMFTTKSFRSQVLLHVTDSEVLKFWKDEFPNMNYKNAFDGVAPFANKLGAFLSHPQIRKALCNPDKPIRFRQLMDDGIPLAVNLSKGKLGSDITNVLGGLIVSMMANAAYTRTDTPEHVRRPYIFYADEFHSFTTESFAGMLSELRKYGLGLVLAHQYTRQLEKSVFESILGNVDTLIVFRVGATDAPLLSKQLGTRVSVPQCINPVHLTELPNYGNYVRLII